MTLNLEAKKVLLRKIPHGLFICGVRDENKDEINGFTASWVTQGSFNPPLVVMAVRAEGSSHEIIKNSKKFSLNVLRSDQKDLAAVFFKPQKALGGRFESVDFTLGDNGLPILSDSIGGVECSVVGNVFYGDHTVFVGEVISAYLNNDVEALNLSSTGWNYGG
tara:strand:- start:95 stop:583 length:489 start_codon:yes stop_codon:yes gene_type:complete